MSAWKAGRVLWYDQISEEGLVIDTDGNTFYVNKAASVENTAHLKDNSKVKFTVYDNGYISQIDNIKVI